MSKTGEIPQGPVPIQQTPVKSLKQPYTMQDGRPPIDAMKDMGKRDIQRHELAEEAIRQHFRDNYKRLQETHKLNKLA